MNPRPTHPKPRDPHQRTGALPELSRTPRGALIAATLLLIPVVVLAGGDGLREGLDFTSGVLALVALTCSVVWGLVASDRIFLSTRQRLLAQAVHRATAVASIGFLLLHGTVKLALDHVSLLGALVPFSLGVRGTGGLIGFGALGGLLMVATGVTGALRSAFASPARIAGRWRALHTLAYPAWCAALLHGLYAGREPSGWAVALYCLCLLAVGGALALRAAPPPIKRKVARRILGLLAPEPPLHRATQDPPRRRTPLPGMQPTTPPPGQEPGRHALDRSERPERPPYASPRPLPHEHRFAPPAPPLYEAPFPHEPPPFHEAPPPHEPPPLHASPPHASADPRPPGNHMTAAYRAVSTPGHPRWPSPSPPPPTAVPYVPAPPAYSPRTPTDPPRAYDPFHPVDTPTAAHPSPSARPPHHAPSPQSTCAPPAQPPHQDPPGTREEHAPATAPDDAVPHGDGPFGAPASGEPWSPYGATGGSR